MQCRALDVPACFMLKGIENLPHFKRFQEVAREKTEVIAIGTQEKRAQLEEICRRSGRAVSYGKNGQIYTFTPYDPTDQHTFIDINEAIEWESGYIPYKQKERRKRHDSKRRAV